MQQLRVKTIPSNSRYSFIQLSELERRGVDELSQIEIVTRRNLVTSTLTYLWTTGAIARGIGHPWNKQSGGISYSLQFDVGLRPD